MGIGNRDSLIGNRESYMGVVDGNRESWVRIMGGYRGFHDTHS